MAVITKKDLEEAVAVSALILKALQGTLAGQTGLAGAKTNFLCGQLLAYNSAELVAGGTKFWLDFQNCFEAAQQSGASFQAMGNVLATANALTPVGIWATAVKNFSIRMSLLEQARILAATNFTSRQQIDEYFDAIDASFQAAELTAADNLDNVAYTALINVHAMVSNDLSTRSFSLPTIVTYSFPARIPALLLAQRLYQDASRTQELIGENSAINPLFMPSSGHALAS